MLTTGFSLAVITATGFYLIYHKLPESIRRFMQKHVLLTDALACTLTYMLFGGTLVALFAAAFMGIFTSLMLALAADPRTAGMLEAFATKLGQLKEKVINGLAAIAERKENGEVGTANIG